MNGGESPVLLVSSDNAVVVDVVVRQGRRRWHVAWQELSVEAVARRSLRHSPKLILVSSAVGLSRMIQRVAARVKGLVFYWMSDQSKHVLVVAKRSSVLPDCLASTQRSLRDIL